ncbi:hypothetical protein UA08_07258 [Talaromyces atroroseus]|uniref:Uncharacterized protein n=1 Tax=Talaromyces atroroseus TaxID=1441469 RepID=A0A225AER0_TALAT|nr:hypothetical protein UA08_07258 [Talaromyces atroroseus]OKL57563.1 hypothetical protein UA08_07258 [Talaromyces atroroseus]
MARTRARTTRADPACRLKSAKSKSTTLRRTGLILTGLRAGYPRLLRPSVRSEPIANNDANPITEAKFEELKSRIDTIIDAHNIPRGPNDPAVMYRAQRWGTSMLPRVIVDCIYDEETSNSKMWTNAVTEIYAAAKRAAEGRGEIGVELFDWRYTNTSHICTPPDSDSQELKANRNEGHCYRRQILQLFENRPPMFQAMIPVGRCATGERAYEWTTVILFDAINAEDVVWDFLEERMRSILPAKFPIEIRQRAGPLFCNGDLEDERLVVVGRYMRPPIPGCEISQQHESSPAGTMGGYIITEAKDTKRRTTFGVTNAHVALASYEETCFSTPAAEEISIQSPDVECRRQHETLLLNRITKTKERIQTTLDIVDAVKETEPSLSQRLENSLILNQPRLASLTRDLQTDKLMMDLALIKVDCLADKRPQEVYWQKSAVNPPIWEDTTCNFWEVDSLAASKDAEKHINVVAKLSRSGAYTMGVVSGFKADTIPFYKNGQPTLKKVEAWAITCPRRHESEGDFMAYLAIAT